MLSGCMRASKSAEKGSNLFTQKLSLSGIVSGSVRVTKREQLIAGSQVNSPKYENFGYIGSRASTCYNEV